MNFISSIAWVPRGKAKEIPETVNLKPDELKELFEGARSDIQDTSDIDDKEDDEESSGNDDEWSDEEEEKSDVDLDADAEEPEDPATAGASGFSVSSLAVFPTNDDDPYVEIKDADDVDSEDEDFKIQPRDNQLAVAHIDEDANLLEVYVWNEENGDNYIHHDVMLPSYPLAMEWLSHVPGSETDGNLLAIGSMKSTIQIWDLDLVNAMEPLFELKGMSKKRKRNQNAKSPTGHSDAVLALAWNTQAEHVLASGSADHTVILWDLDQGKPATALKGFTDNVQAIKWRPGFADQILCGSCDKTVQLFDCRLKKPSATSWTVEGEVERVLWSPDDNHYFHVATEDGQLYTFDIRNTKAPLSVIPAHGKNITGLTASAIVPGLLVTTSEDKRVKVWDIQANHTPELISERKLKMGELQFAVMSPDSPFVIALGGEDSDCNFRIIDLYNESDEVRLRFQSRIPETHQKTPPVPKGLKKEQKPEPAAVPHHRQPENGQANSGASLPTTSGALKKPKIKHAKRRGLLPAQSEETPSKPNSTPVELSAAPPARPPRFRPKNEHGKRVGWTGQDKRRSGGETSQKRTGGNGPAESSSKKASKGQKKFKVGKS